ncbi:MAG: NADPH-dependent F420 reductase [Methanomicrobiales archaeon]|nr:NADPH-dependent F420 reductase [Methanomicrobiales archaeon]
MRIGIIGGTGGIGEGMALRMAPFHTVVIGSRETEKAQVCCRECEEILMKKGLSCSLIGKTNQETVDFADLVILAIPFKFLVPTLQELKGLEGKVVVSPVNPIEKTGEYFSYVPPSEGSAALLARKLLPEGTQLCLAFNNIAANRWRDLDDPLEYSVAVCGDDMGAKRKVMELAAGTPHLRPLDAGPLAVAPLVESLTPLLLNLGRFNRMKDVGVRFF